MLFHFHSEVGISKFRVRRFNWNAPEVGIPSLPPVKDGRPNGKQAEAPAIIR